MAACIAEGVKYLEHCPCSVGFAVCASHPKTRSGTLGISLVHVRNLVARGSSNRETLFPCRKQSRLPSAPATLHVCPFASIPFENLDPMPYSTYRGSAKKQWGVEARKGDEASPFAAAEALADAAGSVLNMLLSSSRVLMIRSCCNSSVWPASMSRIASSRPGSLLLTCQGTSRRRRKYEARTTRSDGGYWVSWARQAPTWPDVANKSFPYPHPRSQACQARDGCSLASAPTFPRRHYRKHDVHHAHLRDRCIPSLFLLGRCLYASHRLVLVFLPHEVRL